MFTLTQNTNSIISSGGFYYLAQTVYIMLIIAVTLTIFNFIMNLSFYKKNKKILMKNKNLNKIKILNLISLVLFPMASIGMIMIISFL